LPAPRKHASVARRLLTSPSLGARMMAALGNASARTRPGEWRHIRARTPGCSMPGVPRIRYPQGEEARPCRRVPSSRRQPVRWRWPKGRAREQTYVRRYRGTPRAD
jgi:hypothetical protein